MAFLPLCFISMLAIAFAVPSAIQGSPITVNISYAIALQTTGTAGYTVTLTAALSNVSIAVPSQSISFYHCNAVGGHTSENATALAIITENPTTATWNQPEVTNGVFHYIAEWTSGSTVIQSPVLTVNITYTLVSGTPTVSAFTVTLKATLKNNGVPISGATVKFFHSDANGVISGSSLGSVITDVNGVATLLYTETANGVYRYIPVYQPLT